MAAEILPRIAIVYRSNAFLPDVLIPATLLPPSNNRAAVAVDHNQYRWGA
jgi:hypothetical protein